MVTTSHTFPLATLYATCHFIPSTQLLVPTEAVPEDVEEFLPTDSILGLYMDKPPAPYYVDHENPTKDQKEDTEAEFPFYQMGAIEDTHDLIDESCVQ